MYAKLKETIGWAWYGHPLGNYNMNKRQVLLNELPKIIYNYVNDDKVSDEDTKAVLAFAQEFSTELDDISKNGFNANINLGIELKQAFYFSDLVQLRNRIMEEISILFKTSNGGDEAAKSYAKKVHEDLDILMTIGSDPFAKLRTKISRIVHERMEGNITLKDTAIAFAGALNTSVESILESEKSEEAILHHAFHLDKSLQNVIPKNININGQAHTQHLHFVSHFQPGGPSMQYRICYDSLTPQQVQKIAEVYSHSYRFIDAKAEDNILILDANTLLNDVICHLGDKRFHPTQIEHPKNIQEEMQEAHCPKIKVGF